MAASGNERKPDQKTVCVSSARIFIILKGLLYKFNILYMLFRTDTPQPGKLKIR